MKAREFLTNFTDLNEFAPAGSNNGVPPRGPKTPGKDPWSGNDSPGDDPYSRPEPEYYSRSIDFFGKFEADHFDKEDFNEKTGVFKGYWDYDGELKQIAYFKFDDPKQAARNFDDSPGMGWYYEPQNEDMSEDAEPIDREFHLVKKLGRLGERIVQNPKLWDKYSEAIDNGNNDWIISLIQEGTGADKTEVMKLAQVFSEIGGGLGRLVDFAWAVKEGTWEEDFLNPYRQHRAQDTAEALEPEDIHDLADEKNVSWDNDPEFMNTSKELTGKSHLDDMDQDELEIIKRFISKK